MPRKKREEKLQEYIEEAQREIAYCLNCQPRDSGEWVWVFGEQYEMGDFLGGYLGIPEEYWEEVADSLVCPHCGTELNMGYDVGLPSSYEKAVNAKWDDWYEQYDWRFEEFYEFLEKYPYLGSHHELGKEILDKISSLPVCSIEGELWYRARKLQDGKLRETSEMYPPNPHEVEISEGRFNHFGQQVFYLAKSADGAVKETLDQDEIVGWIQRFVVNSTHILDLTSEPFGEPSTALDLLAFGLIHARVIEKKTQRSKGWKPEYFVPRYIADCARMRGIHGVKFKSTRHYENNLVLFEWSSDAVVAIEVPYLYSLNKSIEEDPFSHLLGDICINFFAGREAITLNIIEDMLQSPSDSSTYNIFEAAVYLSTMNKKALICGKTVTADLLTEKIALTFLESPREIPESYKQLPPEVKNRLWEILSTRYHMKRFD